MSSLSELTIEEHGVTEDGHAVAQYFFRTRCLLVNKSVISAESTKSPYPLAPALWGEGQGEGISSRPFFTVTPLLATPPAPLRGKPKACAVFVNVPFALGELS